MLLNGKAAVITGAGSGQGRAAALLFAKEGAKIVVADLVEEDGRETVSLIKEKGGEAVFVLADVSREEDVKHMIETALQAFGKIDILYNNAGITMNPERPVDQVERGSWDKVVAVDLTGPFLASKYALPALRASGSGVIINTSSTSGVMPRPGCCAYAAAKGGVISFTKQLAHEAAKDKIRVNSIVPGPVYTTMMKARMQELGPEKAGEMKRGIMGLMPLGEAIGDLIQAEDVANCALFLASDLSRMITGETIRVDGGMCLK